MSARLRAVAVPGRRRSGLLCEDDTPLHDDARRAVRPEPDVLCALAWVRAPTIAGSPRCGGASNGAARVGAVTLLNMSSDKDPQPPEEILAYYARGLEDQRLSEGKGWLERRRTEELLERHLPPPPAKLLDVGRGTGHYAALLARREYTVHLIDPVPLHLEQAAVRSAEQRQAPLASIALGDARHLSWSDAEMDAVLLFGPLYHLTEAQDRMLCLREACRVLRPGGTLLAVVISRFASTLDGLVSHLFADPQYDEIAWQDLATGRHRGIADKYFTTAYLHHPENIESEVAEAGFTAVRVVAVEGPGWLLQDFQVQWANPRLQDIILEVVRRTEGESSLLGTSSHLMAIATKPGN
jgi:ubiquinone/menaquinone biosynthesis C-methylase UbiE